MLPLGVEPHQAEVARVPGTTLKYLLIDREKRPCSFVLCSSPEEPDVVSRAVKGSQAARRALGALGQAVLTPWDWGDMEGLSYAIYSVCRPLSRSRYAWVLQRSWLRPRLLAWLREATRTTCYGPSADEQEEAFRAPLAHFEGLRELPEALRKSARTSLERLDAGIWNPKHCLMHGDLWKSNIMCTPGINGWSQFVLIDWPGSLVRGYGIYDLMTVAPSLRLKGASLRAEVELHCRILGCEFADARSNLMGALAHIEAHRGHFPWERFVAMASRSLQFLDTIGG